MSSSSSFVPQCRPNESVLLSSLLLSSKDDTRRWLRAEMDRLVDPVLHSIFNRLNNKLANVDLDRLEHVGDRAQMNPLNHIEFIPNSQPSNSNSVISTDNFNPQSNQPHSTGYEPEYDPEILAQVKREIKEEENERELMNLMDNAPKANQQIENCIIPAINEEFDKNEKIMDLDETSNDELITIPNQTRNTSQSLTNASSTSNEQSNHSLTNWEDEEDVQDLDQVNPNDQRQFDDDETNNREIEIEREDDETDDKDDEIRDDNTEIDTDNGEAIGDYEDVESSRHVRNAPIDTTPPPNGQSLTIRQSVRISKRKQIEEVQPEVTNEVNNRDVEEEYDEDDEEEHQEITSRKTSRSVKRSRPTTSSDTQEKLIITVTLQCPQVGCEKMIPKNDLKKHLKEEHSIGPVRCPLKDCKESFEAKKLLGDHIAQFHQHTTQWHCDKCSNRFTTYKQLSVHTIQLHQLGLFQCSFPSCTFTGDYKKQVYSHYRHQHKQTVNKKCAYPDCQYQTFETAQLNKHQRVHSGAKPYKCKWPQCDFTSNDRSNTIRHIRRQHLAQSNSRSISSGSQLDPKNYVELVHENCCE